MSHLVNLKTMGKFVPSKYQKDFFNFLKNGTGNAVISAVAGSGKSTTLIHALNIIPQDKKVLFMAFNKSIANELKEKVPKTGNITVMTVHGFGYQTLKNNNPEIQIDNYKYHKLLKHCMEYLQNHTKTSIEQYGFDVEHLEYIVRMGKAVTNEELNVKDFTSNVKDICNLGRLHFIDTVVKNIGVDELDKICEKYDIDNEDGQSEVAWYLIKLGIYCKNVIDFTDMIFFPNNLNLSTEKFDFVFVDEIQDLSTSQRLLMLRAIKEEGGRFCGVGDFRQCQPIGTKILMYDGSEKNIEDIKIGDSVVSYDYKHKGAFIGYYKNYFRGPEIIKNLAPKVIDIQKRLFTRKIIVIDSNNKISKYTPNHICYVKFNSEKIGGYGLYLMNKGDDFRIGITPIWSKNLKNSVTNRVRSEGGEKFWLLDIFEDKYSAYVKEQYYSLIYGIPQTIFKLRYKTEKITQEKIDDFYRLFDKKELFIRANNLLTHFNREYDYPLWVQGGVNYLSKTHLFEIRACNIISKWMSVKHFDGNTTYKRTHGKTQRNEYHLKGFTYPIENLTYENYKDYVYSLKIEKFGNYVADGILTHNCIYSFAGADIESFQKLCDLPNTIQLPLSITYRCHKQIVDRVKHINPDIKPHKTNNNGIIHEEYSVKDIRDGDMILCRNTFPVVSLCIKFLKEGKKAYLIGSDVGLSLITMIEDCQRKSEEFTMLNVYSRLYDNLEKLIEKMINNHGITRDEAKEDTHIILYDEKIAVIEALSEGVTDPKEVILKIKTIFSDNKNEGICLSNIHKSKGLEAERVFILQPELMPSKYAKKSWEIQQEHNLRYVAYTRAKTTLGFITDYDAFKQHTSQSTNVTKPVESKHVGEPGMKMNLKLKVIGKRSFKGQFGDTIVYEMVDKNGNIFSKFGEIGTSFISQGNEKEVDINSHVSFYGVIKENTEFRGTKITKLGKISHY